MIRLLKIMTLALTLSLASSGCEKSGDNGASRMLAFHLHTVVGGTAATYGAEFQKNGRKFNLSDARYYISNIVLIKNDNSTYPLTGKVILAGPTQLRYELGQVPTGVYKGFTFLLGLDSLTNHSDPTARAVDDPLAIQSPGIHWSWNSGYIFMKLEGQVDTTFGATGSPSYDFFYHIGLDEMSRTVDFSSAAFSVSGSGENEIGLEFNLLQVLNGVDMRTENETHTFNNLPLATEIANNLQSAFSLE